LILLEVVGEKGSMVVSILLSMKETFSTQKKLEKEGAAYKPFETVQRTPASYKMDCAAWICLNEIDLIASKSTKQTKKLRE
jgi:hypothetical protein